MGEALTGQCAVALWVWGTFCQQRAGQECQASAPSGDTGIHRASTCCVRGSADWEWVRLRMTTTEEDPGPHGVRCAWSYAGPPQLLIPRLCPHSELCLLDFSVCRGHFLGSSCY